MLIYFKQSPSGLIIMILINCMLMMFPRLFFLFYLILLLTLIHHNLILGGSNKSRLIFSICGVPVLHFHHSMVGSFLFDGRWRLWDTLPSFKQLFFNVRWVTWFLIFLSLIFLLIILKIFLMILRFTSCPFLSFLFDFSLNWGSTSFIAFWKGSLVIHWSISRILEGVRSNLFLLFVGSKLYLWIFWFLLVSFSLLNNFCLFFVRVLLVIGRFLPQFLTLDMSLHLLFYN